MEIRLLGPLDVVRDQRSAVLGGPRQCAVLAMLALGQPEVVSVDRLVDGIWGDDPPAKPLPTLQVFVHNLRKALGVLDADRGRALIASRSPGYVLALTEDDTTDLARLIALRQGSADHAAAGRFADALAALEAALRLWRGPALADLRDLPFAGPDLARLDEQRLLTEEDAVDLRLQLGDHQALVPGLEARVRSHPTRERSWAQLMVALYRSERQGDALTTYARARTVLADELGIDPGEALRQLEVAVLRQDPALSSPAPSAEVSGGATPAVPPPVVPAPVVAPRSPARVPRPLTATVGREDDLAEVGALLRSEAAALVTLTGVGGAGKSRLATLVAGAVDDDFPGGVWFLPFAEPADTAEITTLLARTILGAEPADDPVAAVDTWLAGRRGLVVLDDIEDAARARASIGALLAGAPTLAVLATSRLPLRIAGEHEYPVAPLGVPRQGADASTIAATPAVRMFLARAQAAARSFALDDSNIEAVAELCRLLDGLPLALELAAARVRVMSPQRIGDALRAGLDVLVSTSSDAPERQRTITATIEWSLAHLSDDARALCAQLAVFEDAFTLDAVEAVCADPSRSPLPALTDLLDAGLVRSAASRVEVRFGLLGTVRTVLRGRAADEAEAERARLRLAAWSLIRARGWSAELDGDGGDLALGRFEDELPDLHAALDTFAAAHQHAELAELVGALHGFWIASGRAVQGFHLVETALTTDGLGPTHRAYLRAIGGKLAYQRTEWATAEQWCRAALEPIGGPGHDEPGHDEPGHDELARLAGAVARCYLAGTLAVTGQGAAAVPLAEQALTDAVAVADYPTHVAALSVLAIAAAVSGDFDAERRRYEDRLALVRAQGDRARIADTLNTLAEIALDEQDPDGARMWAGESLELAGERLPLEHRDALITLARVDVIEHAHERAAQRLRAALALSERTGQALGTAQCWRVTACLVAEAQPDLAVRLFAAAHRLHPSPSGTEEPVEADLAARLAAARQHLGTARSAREWALGISLPTSRMTAAVTSVLDAAERAAAV